MLLLGGVSRTTVVRVITTVVVVVGVEQRWSVPLLVLFVNTTTGIGIGTGSGIITVIHGSSHGTGARRITYF